MGSSIQFFLRRFKTTCARCHANNIWSTLWAQGLEDALSSDHQAQHKVSTASTATFSTWLNERCKRGTTKKAHAVPKPMGAPPSLQSRSACPDPSVGIHICSSKTHTLAQNSYKAHCLLSETGFDRAALPVCEWLFVRRLRLFETCSLIPTRSLCVCECWFYEQADKQH